MTSHAMLSLALLTALSVGCDDGKQGQGVSIAPRGSAIEVRGDTRPREKKPLVPTDVDRAVIAYLDAWEPFHRDVMAGFQTARKNARGVQMDQARRRPTDPQASCAEIAALLERYATWKREHAAPVVLDGGLGDYRLELSGRRGRGEDVAPLLRRIEAHADHRGDFERRPARELQEFARELACKA